MGTIFSGLDAFNASVGQSEVGKLGLVNEEP
jgi:hypothetical protein